MELLTDIVLDAIVDTLRILPFLFACYLIMEAIEHAAGDKAEHAIAKAGPVGPLVGAVLGAFPQCGFSTAAATFYAGRVITLGTLFAVFLATSDEMLPIMIAESAPLSLMLTILGAKVAIGMIMGFTVDLLIRFVGHRGALHHHIHDMCHNEHCECDDGVLKSATKHTLQVLLFIFVITLVIDGVVALVGEDVLAQFLAANPFISIVTSATVGLIPNCAASVVITELFLDGTITTGAMMAGLLVSPGVGLLVLIRANKPIKRTLLIILGLWVMGVVWGLFFDLTGITFLVVS